jgi:hypothetical protein
MSLNDICGAGIDFMNTTDADIKNLLKIVEFDPAPESNLILKKSIIKREAGAFNRFKDATAVLTRDK